MMNIKNETVVKEDAAADTVGFDIEVSVSDFCEYLECTVLNTVESNSSVKRVIGLSRRVKPVDMVDVEIDKVLTSMSTGSHAKVDSVKDCIMVAEVRAFTNALNVAMDKLKTMIARKNAKYGNAVAVPPSLFSKECDIIEKIHVRMDDKIAILTRGDVVPSEEIIADLLAYILLRFAVLESLGAEEVEFGAFHQLAELLTFRMALLEM